MTQEQTAVETPAADRPVGTAAKKAAKRPSKAVVTKAAPKAAKAKPAKKAKKVASLKTGPSKSVIPLDVAKSYERAKDKAGKLHVDNGDKIATVLRNHDLAEIYALVSKKCDIPAAELKRKYGHLNPGMQRMNLGNKLRAVAQ